MGTDFRPPVVFLCRGAGRARNESAAVRLARRSGGAEERGWSVTACDGARQGAVGVGGVVRGVRPVPEP